ncbi:AAA family ATPase [Demequina iriomotensis]|uniref:AAA family ATPase n=1 Tax=Demequina iriomotensis TaxID=1536641 RepID=UPI00078622CE|nr:AAA family ATPase [Demequina iriomotensis]
MGHSPSVLTALADAVATAASSLTHPLRVGLDGADGAGKTTMRGALAAELRGRGADVIEASLDDFHHPRAHRYRQGRDSWRGYTDDAFDLARARRDLLDPLGPGGNLRFRTRSLDLAADREVDDPWREARADAIVLVDGVMLQRPELAGAFDRVVLLEASEPERYRRLAIRDGADPEPEARDNLRYTLAHRHYRAFCRPVDRADIVIDNEDAAAPRILTGARP